LSSQQPKPSSSAGIAFTPYDTFDSIDGLSTSGAENEDTLTMSMIDFLQNEVTPPPKLTNVKQNASFIKPFTSISSHAIGLISAMHVRLLLHIFPYLYTSAFIFLKNFSLSFRRWKMKIWGYWILRMSSLTRLRCSATSQQIPHPSNFTAK
jgi:hypothetical protein